MKYESKKVRGEKGGKRGGGGEGVIWNILIYLQFS
jgi:hypothetical protein